MSPTACVALGGKVGDYVSHLDLKTLQMMEQVCVMRWRVNSAMTLCSLHQQQMRAILPSEFKYLTNDL
jgi:hypothetical protein